MPLLTTRVVLTMGALAIAAGVLGCERGRARTAHVAGGDPSRGRDLVRSYGCHTCHTIPGVRGADGLVGPSLERIASRVYVAGHLPNTPDNLVRWIRHPRDVSPDTAMPDTGVTAEDARHIAAYLYTLR